MPFHNKNIVQCISTVKSFPVNFYDKIISHEISSKSLAINLLLERISFSVIYGRPYILAQNYKIWYTY